MPSTDCDGTPILILRLEDVKPIGQLLDQICDATKTGKSNGYLQHFILADTRLGKVSEKVKRFLDEAES